MKLVVSIISLLFCVTQFARKWETAGDKNARRYIDKNAFCFI